MAPAGFSQSLSDGFDSYVKGSSLDGQCGWEGWDGINQNLTVVTDTFAFDGTQSVSIVQDADTIQNFALTSGQWTISSQVYVPSGNTGSHWFVLLDEYNHGGPYEWGGQIEFNNATGMVECDCGGGNNFVANIVYDAWAEIRLELDLDTDFAEIHYDGQLLGSWTWSTGTFGGSNNVPIGFEAIDLYAASPSTGMTYFDAVKAVPKESGSTYCDETQNANNVADLTIDTLDAGAASINLTLSNGPPGQPGYLLVGDGHITVNMPPGANGDLCVTGGGCLGRYDQDVFVISSCGIGNTDIKNAISVPCNGGVNIDPGVTWNFQYWHRQPMGQPSTFSAALAVTFN